MVVPPPQLAKRLVLRRSLDRRLCLLRARGGIADDKARLDGVVAGGGFVFDPVMSRCVVSGESLATLVGQAVVGNTFHSGLALAADWQTADCSHAATTARMRRESTPPPWQTADPAPRVVRRSARGRIYLLRARADPGANARIDAIAASGGIAVDTVVVPRDDDSLTTLVDRIAVDANGALTVHFGEDIRASPPSATIVSAVKGHLPETASKERALARSSLIVTRMMPVPAPEAAGEACTPRAADAAKAGPLPSSSVPAVGAATEHGPPIGDVDASPDGAKENVVFLATLAKRAAAGDAAHVGHLRSRGARAVRALAAALAGNTPSTLRPALADCLHSLCAHRGRGVDDACSERVRNDRRWRRGAFAPPRRVRARSPTTASVGCYALRRRPL